MADLNTDETQEVIVRSGTTSNNELEVNSDGSINTKSLIASLTDSDKSFGISTSITITGGGTENDFLLIRNPSQSGKQLKFDTISVGFNNTVSVMASFKIYATPTITSNGTAVTINPGRIGASVPASSINVYSTPTISSRGTEYANFMVTGGPNSGSSYRFNVDQTIIVDPGYSLLITGTPDGINRNLLLTLRWIEV
jgi:hypothetical protein